VREKVMLRVPLNRVEGDLEIKVEIDDGVVTDAWSSGMMYRGFENLLVGRGPLDGLVLTPRICGICSTAHLTAAALALDMISGSILPPDAIRLRNVTLMVEQIQSDIRHAFLMFCADFANPSYKSQALYEEAVRRFEPFRGETVLETIRETKKLIEIIAIIGGQWPHSSFIVPGGVTSTPGLSGLLQCRYLLDHFKAWYERRVLGCSIERFREIQTASDLDEWLEESPLHRASDLGFFIRISRELGLDRIGRGHGNFLSFGGLNLPVGTQVRALKDGDRLIASGFVRGDEASELKQDQISECVSHSWFVDYGSGRHPFQGETQPYATGREGKKYSWAKAPRYEGLPAETGPLAEAVVSGNPLFLDLIGRCAGASAYVRELARLVRPVELLPAMQGWLSELSADGSFYAAPRQEIYDGWGYGLIEATRGGLGHWVSIVNGRIERYQIITPTAWNGSPRDSQGVRGPCEEALVGTILHDPFNPVELGHVVRSFDPCLVCTVHALGGK
jgi:hydrogenase large subunit